MMKPNNFHMYNIHLVRIFKLIYFIQVAKQMMGFRNYLEKLQMDI